MRTDFTNACTKLKRNFQPFDVHICHNPLSPPILNSIVYVHVCMGENRGWVKSERWQIAYCRKINTICNSSREQFSIQSFSVITWRLNGTFIFIAAVQLNYIHYLLDVRYFKVLTQKCRIIGQLALCFFCFLFHSLTPSAIQTKVWVDCSFSHSNKKKSILVLHKVRKQ